MRLPPNYLYYSPGCATWRDFSVPLSGRSCAYEADAFGSRGSGDYVHNDGSHQRRVGQRPGGTGPSGVCSLDLGLVLFNQCATVVLGVVEMVLEPCTGMVPRLGWLGLGRDALATSCRRGYEQAQYQKEPWYVPRLFSCLHLRRIGFENLRSRKLSPF
jgi:hypothetical protein